jgi:surface antigen
MVINRSFKRTLIAAALLIAVTSCSSNQQNYEKTGELVGTFAGAAIGLALGDDFAAGAGGVIGMVVGNLLGKAIGAHLDEVDRIKAEVAMLSALQMNQNTKVKWKSDNNPGIRGEVHTKEVSKNGDVCKSVTQIVNVNGKETREENTLCRESDGSWVLS